MASAPSERVRQIEENIDKRLKPALERAIAKRNEVFEQQKTFSDLRRNIENLEKNTVTSMSTLINIGSEIYTEADAPDTQHIFVDIGLGLYVEFTWSEALNYIAAREERLSRSKSNLEGWSWEGDDDGAVDMDPRFVLVSCDIDQRNGLKLLWVGYTKIEEHTRLIASIKALIKLFLELIRDELKLPVPEAEHNIY